jgi:parvulin-like peptidyl-prolyl isomerase
MVLQEESVLPTNDDDKAKGEIKPVVAAKKSSAGSSSKGKAEIKPKVVTTSKAPVTSGGAIPSSASAVKTVGGQAQGVDANLSTSGNSYMPGRSFVWKAAGIVAGLLVLVVVVFGVLIYVYQSENSAVKAVASIVPYPVLRVNGHFVSYSDYLFEVDAENRAYESNAKLNNQAAPDFSSASGKKLETQIKQHSLTKLESDAIVAQLASQMNVKVTDQQVQGPINELYKQYGGQATLLKTLNQIYGWDLNDLKSVVRKQLLAQDVQNKVTSDPSLSAAAKAKAEGILVKLKNGADFATLAKQNSQSQDASNGGNMGYFTKAQVPSPLYNGANALSVGQLSNVIQDQYGFVILKVLDKKSDGSISAQEILIEPVDYNSYFQDKLNQAKVNTYIKV